MPPSYSVDRERRAILTTASRPISFDDIGVRLAAERRSEFDAHVLALARTVAEGPTRAYGIAKGLVNQAAGVDRLDDHLDRELDSLARIADGPDFAEGLEAFFARRSPRFGGSDPAGSRRSRPSAGQ